MIVQRVESNCATITTPQDPFGLLKTPFQLVTCLLSKRQLLEKQLDEKPIPIKFTKQEF